MVWVCPPWRPPGSQYRTLEPGCLKGLPREAEGGTCGGLEFRTWGSAGGMICQADMCTLTAGFDPVWTHLHNTFCSISHTTLFILHDVDTHNANQNKEWSVARLFTVFMVLNMVHTCIVWT